MPKKTSSGKAPARDAHGHPEAHRPRETCLKPVVHLNTFAPIMDLGLPSRPPQRRQLRRISRSHALSSANRRCGAPASAEYQAAQFKTSQLLSSAGAASHALPQTQITGQRPAAQPRTSSYWRNILAQEGGRAWSTDVEVQRTGMSTELARILTQLGLTQYLGVLVDEGFDTWEAVLDIQEPDLEALGVKLGHRRLQRHIANARGLDPESSLADLTKVQEGSSADVLRNEWIATSDSDQNAPERPATAYVRFSNKFREELKDQNITFAEKAKLVGKNWQALTPDEKAEYESRANAEKDQYRLELEEYQKTDDHRKYSQYLSEFRQEAKGKGKRRHNRRNPELSLPGYDSNISSRAVGRTSRGASAASIGLVECKGNQSPTASETTFIRIYDDTSFRTSPANGRLKLGDNYSQLPPPTLERGQKRVNSPKSAQNQASSRTAQQLRRDEVAASLSNSLQRGLGSPASKHSSAIAAATEQSGDSPSANGGTATETNTQLTQQYGPAANAKGTIGYGFESASSAFQNMEIEQTLEGDVLLKTDRRASVTTRSGVLDGISALIRADEMGKDRERGEYASRT
ncbi:transcriptional regulator family: HMG [Purpureocillium lilacinum]|uniref:Transcriptional regulator family: HMG n=1 Tax=Purpureocillium lilacinum TaxID=33203 RepID=A0ABR0BI45_PURLI|nr:transcriptional regulator family: HMG [Purpureocillium lilacinum]